MCTCTQLKMDCCFPDVSLETMQIWWVQLKKYNKSFTKKRAELEMPFFAASEKMVTLICNIGHFMELPRETLLSSITLFDRFMSFSYTKISQEKSKAKKKELMEKLKENMTMTICSCLQLSSKALGHQVLVPDIVKFMSKYDREVTKTEILISEQNVFRTLKYKVPAFSPLIYTETLVHLLFAEELDLQCPLLMETCAQFMTIAYCHNQVLYDSLYYVLTSEETCFYKDRLAFLCVEMDQLYLAGAVVLAAMQCLGGIRPWTLRRLQVLTGVPARELQRLAAILTDIATPTDSDSEA